MIPQELIFWDTADNCGQKMQTKDVDRCGLSAIMRKNADKLRKNADKLWTCGNENALIKKSYV
jgi:hypothetical protein